VPGRVEVEGHQGENIRDGEGPKVQTRAGSGRGRRPSGRAVITDLGFSIIGTSRRSGVGNLWLGSRNKGLVRVIAPGPGPGHRRA
jgi:hypothetical protein